MRKKKDFKGKKEKKGKLRWLEGHRGKNPRMYLLNGTKITGVKGKI